MGRREPPAQTGDTAGEGKCWARCWEQGRAYQWDRADGSTGIRVGDRAPRQSRGHRRGEN